MKVTVGSAIQIGQFVMPGCVLVGWVMDKGKTMSSNTIFSTPDYVYSILMKLILFSFRLRRNDSLLSWV